MANANTSRDAALGALILLLLEAGVAGGVLAWRLGLAPLVVGHVLVLSGAAAWLSRPARRTARHAWLLWLSTAALGPLGPAGVLVALGCERRYAPRASSIDEWHQALFPSLGVDASAELWRRIGQRASDRPADPRVTPFLDVLAFGSVPQKQAVVAIIGQQFRPAFAPALGAALRDEHNVVRVQAATVIARLEQEFLETTLRLESALRDAPDDPQALLAVATHYDEQAFAGLFDPAREEECRTKAADGYEGYLRVSPADHVVELRLARLQLRRRRFDEAEPRLRRLADGGHASARLWLMEALFAQRRYADVRATAALIVADTESQLAPEATSAIDLWAGREIAA